MGRVGRAARKLLQEFTCVGKVPRPGSRPKASRETRDEVAARHVWHHRHPGLYRLDERRSRPLHFAELAIGDALRRLLLELERKLLHRVHQLGHRVFLEDNGSAHELAASNRLRLGLPHKRGYVDALCARRVGLPENLCGIKRHRPSGL